MKLVKYYSRNSLILSWCDETVGCLNSSQNNEEVVCDLFPNYLQFSSVFMNTIINRVLRYKKNIKEIYELLLESISAGNVINN